MQMNSVWNGIGNFYAARSDILSSGAVSYLLTYLLTYGNGNFKTPFTQNSTRNRRTNERVWAIAGKRAEQ